MRMLADQGINSKQWGYDAVKNGFDTYEAYSAKKPGNYSMGNQLTLADVFLRPMFLNAEAYGHDIQ